MKKISILLALGLLVQTANAPLIAYDFDDISTQDDDDDFSIDTDLNNLSLDNVDSSTITRDASSNADTIAFLFGLIANPAAILNSPIYQQTSPIRTRPILEYPFALTYGFDLQDNNSISLMLYLNSSSTKNYTKDGTALSSYFLLGSPEKIAELQVAGEQTAAALGKSLALFDPATVQENRIGGILESHILHNNVILTMQLPILYSERNLQLKPWEKAAISVSPLGQTLTAEGVNESSTSFEYQHFVMDQFGIGDFKFKAMYEVHTSDTFTADFGGFIILPTATALKQGIIGTWHEQNNERAYLDLTSIDVSNITAQNQEDIANFFLAAVDKLSSNILNAPLGNNGHVVIAPSFNCDWFFASKWQLSSDASLQIPLPTLEKRFFQKTQSQAAFQAAYNAAADAGSIPFVDFINQELQDLFFPYVFSTMVFPGVVFNSTNQLVYHHNACLDFYAGSNFWYQQAETLIIPNPVTQQTSTYDYAGATAASAAQEKLFGKINYNFETTNYSWSFGAYGDITVWNSGIGNDFTLGLCLDGKF